jgi:2-alkyl-3-oxoalkanoate reductase
MGHRRCLGTILSASWIDEEMAPISTAANGEKALVTGATGLLGSHLADRLTAQGFRVRALVRAGSRTDFLDTLGVEIVRGDLTDPAACAAAVADVALVFHCAAKVGDWGKWSEFQTGCVLATRILAQAALLAGVNRFVHVSSTSAYGHPTDRETPIDETFPLGQNVWILDYYTRSKVDCERLLWQMADAGLPLTVIRPSWLFGERDRTTAPRLVREFRQGRMMVVGKGDNLLSAVYAGIVADAAMLAARDHDSVGEAYNITSHGRITQREFLNLFADALQVPRVRRQVPFALAFAGGFLLEMQDRLLQRSRPPRVTRYGAWLLGRYLEYSTEKARRRLGWQPSIGYGESIGRTVRWLQEQEAKGSARSSPAGKAADPSLA